MIIQEKAVDWPGIGVEIQPIREYPTGSVTAALVGFLGPVPAALEDFYVERGLVPNRDKVGYAGLELQYQDMLAGRNGSAWCRSMWPGRRCAISTRRSSPGPGAACA